ncbi:hypothetical protein LPJ73_001436, partial [Coemansia sp. RSA 2703]
MSQDSQATSGADVAGTSAPQQQLQSRISDIEREILACQQRLVQISDAKSDTAEDRAVPGSPEHGAEPGDKGTDGDVGMTEALADRVLAQRSEPTHEALVPTEHPDARSPSPTPSSSSDSADTKHHAL